MVRDEGHFRELAERFSTAALGGCWNHALEGLAEAAGATRGQLIGLGSDTAIPFNWITNLDPEAVLEWLQLNGADPRVNARVRAGLKSLELCVETEADFAGEDDLASEVYQLYRRHEINHSCQTTVIREPDFVIGISAMRGDRLGPIDRSAQKVFGQLARHARSAIGLQMAMEAQAPGIVAGALDSVGVAAFVCDRGGQVRALTPAAEALVCEQGHLALAEGRLKALHPQDDARLSTALAAASVRWPEVPVGREIILRATRTAAPLQLQVAPLPKREFAFRFHAATLVIARPPRRPVERGPALQALFGLTPAETEIALMVAQGCTLAEIAVRRNVSVGTLRSQLKSIFGKVGVGRQAELAARLNEL